MITFFMEPFMMVALAGALIAAVTCAYLGVFMILKRIVFMGIALSQAAALGVAIGFFYGFHPHVSSFVFTLLAMVIFWLPLSERDLSRESLLGFGYALSAALSVVMIAKNPLAEAKGLNLVSGNLLYIDTGDFVTLLLATFFVGITHLIFFKEFMFTSFDRETARAAGIKSNMFDLLLYLTIGVTISLSMRICGVVFVFSSLVMPAMTAIFIAGTIGKIFLVSIVVAVTGVVSGMGASYVLDLPSGPAVTAAYAVLFMSIAGAKGFWGRVYRFFR